jgi:radical SAM protein (TIGR01212 family)
MPEHALNTFGRFAAGRYGRPVGKVSLDTGRVCPNRSRGGCIYCSPESFRPFYLEPGDSLGRQLEKGRAYLEGKGIEHFLAYFQQETPTAGDRRGLMDMLRLPLADARCLGLIISTRPDAVDARLASDLRALTSEYPGMDLFVELGLQSSHDDTLRLLNRNHGVDDFKEAVSILRTSGPALQLGAHLILGLPGEGLPRMLGTVRTVAALGLDYVKLHHLQVIRGTRLEEMHRREPLRLYEAEEYLDLLCEVLPHIPRRMVIHRLWSNARRDLLVAPQWGLRTGTLHDRLNDLVRAGGIRQGGSMSGHE